MEIFLSINKTDEMLLLCDTIKQLFMEREEERSEAGHLYKNSQPSLSYTRHAAVSA